MRNPSRTLQNSIFEPLYAREEELHFQPNKPIQSASSDRLPPSLTSSPFSCAPHKASNMRRAAATIFNDDLSEDSSSDKASERVRERESITCDHAILGMHSPSGSSSTIPTYTPSCPPSRSRSSSAVVNYDDGSVASKLLSSITKSISSPSLLACCKESARETPYQKTLRLRKMKLQHCAEELGSESSDGSLCDGDYNNIFDTVSSFGRSSQSTREFSGGHQMSEGNASSVMISVRSSPNLRCTSLVTKHTSQIKERSFPPPLTHSLPRTTSSDSFSYSLRAYREDGRFILKEVKVPCKQYFQSSRKDGRLTLQLLTTDEVYESKHSEEADKECRGLQEDDNVIGMYQAIADVYPENAKGGSCDKIEVESASTSNLVGELEVCRVKESKKIDHVGVDNNIVEKVGCLSAKNLLMATLSNGNCGSSKDDKVNFISHVSASSKIKSDFKAAKHKTSKASRMRLSNQHLLSSSWKQQSPIDPLGKSPKMKLGHDFDVTKFSQCEESLGKLARGVSNGGGKSLLQGFEITTSASLQKSGYGVDKSASSTIIFKDVSAKCLTNLVASFGLDGGKWSCGEQMKSRELDDNSYNSMESSMYNGIKSINIGVREIENGSHKAISGVSFDVECERSFRCGAVKEGDHLDVARSCLPSSSFHFDVQIPSSTNNQAAFQGKEWLDTLHCKEILYRNQLAKGFMKLHCVA